MQILNSVKELQQKLSADGQEKDRQRAERDDGLTEEGAFPQLAKYVLFAALIALNIRLFVTTIGGVWGSVVAGAAVMSGCFAVYCWNRVDKSKGSHLWTMRGLAAGFTILELVHATASVWELTVGIDGEAKTWAVWYSHKVAFPVMAFSIVAGFAAHRYTFWTAEINQARAESRITIAVERARLETEKARLSNDEALALANLEHLQRMQKIEAETRALIAQMTPEAMAEEWREWLEEVRAELPDSVRRRLDEKSRSGTRRADYLPPSPPIEKGYTNGATDWHSDERPKA